MSGLTIVVTAEAAVAVALSLLIVGLTYHYALYSLLAKATRSSEQQQEKEKKKECEAAPSVSLFEDKDLGEVTAMPSLASTPASVAEIKPATSSSGQSPKPSLPKRRSYRIEEEGVKKQSNEFTRRGQLWSRHASWHLPGAPREIERLINEQQLQGIEHVSAILRKYDVDPRRGFLPGQDPLQRLPYARYHLWEDLADDLPKLLGARLGQARDPLRQLPVLSTDKLVTDAELRRAHLLLCLFAHAYVWGGQQPLDVIPEGIAKPLWEVSQRLGIPPILSHTSIVLYNWRRLDAEADICMENLSTLNNFFDGRDESWFYLITVEVEARGAVAIVPMMLAIDAISRYREEASNVYENTSRILRQRSKSRSYSMGSVSADGLEGLSDVDDEGMLNMSRLGSTSLDAHSESRDYDRFVMIGSATGEDYPDAVTLEDALIGELSLQRVTKYVTGQLRKTATAIRGMVASLDTMREGCHPFIFYHRVRPFLSGWKHNPTLVDGVIYQGVSSERQQFYGGSAAQSSLIPFLDIVLGVSHDKTKSKDFLMAMRDYMTREHREFLIYVESVACVREFVTTCLEKRPLPDASGGAPTMDSADDIWGELREAYDECVEGLKQFRTGHISLVAEYIMAQQKKGAVEKGSLEGTAGGKGTGGTDLMQFLKPIRDNCNTALFSPSSADSSAPGGGEGAGGHRAQADVPPPPPPLVRSGSGDFAGGGEARPYTKDNADFEDIDLYRGGTISRMSSGLRTYKLPVVGW